MLGELSIPAEVEKERSWGRILNLSSVAAAKALPGVANYSAAKLALHSLTAALIHELGPSGVTLASVACFLVSEPGASLAARRFA